MKKISQQLSFVVFMFLVGFFVFAGLSYVTLMKFSVNGTVYSKILQGKDLIADVLPPPQNLMESYLIAHQMSNDIDDVHRESLIQKMYSLKREYMTRHEFWKSANLDGNVSTYLIQESYIPAKEFYEIFFDKLVPAVKAKNPNDFALIMQDLEKKYQLHLAALDKVVKLTIKNNNELELSTASHLKNSKMIEIAAFTLIVLIATIVAVFIVRRITISLNHTKSVIESMASNDFTSEIKVYSQDEIGKVAQALVSLKLSFSAVVQQVRTSSESIATASSEIAAGNLDLSTRTEEQASVLAAITGSINNFSTAVQENAKQATSISRSAMDTSRVATQAGVAIEGIVTTMGEIQESSKKVLDIVGVIDSIAFQTNILALNAAVEAARAGEQGRGFAVVATEVRNLAQRSATAAREIKNLIGNSVAVVNRGSGLVNDAGHTIQALVTAVDEVARGITQISNTSNVQGDRIAELSCSVGEIDEVTQQNAALVEQAAAAAASLEEQTHALEKVVAVFKIAS